MKHVSKLTFDTPSPLRSRRIGLIVVHPAAGPPPPPTGQPLAGHDDAVARQALHSGQGLGLAIILSSAAWLFVAVLLVWL